MNKPLTTSLSLLLALSWAPLGAQPDAEDYVEVDNEETPALTEPADPPAMDGIPDFVRERIAERMSEREGAFNAPDSEAPPAGARPASAEDWRERMRARREAASPQRPNTAAASAPAPRTAELLSITPAPEGEPPKLISLNFKDAPLNSVVDYLAESAGFAVVRTVALEGTVDVLSPQALTADEALELVTTVLHQRGFAALRSGRTLTIVRRDEASRRNVPVRQGANPEAIPLSDEIVTQIIPVRYSRAAELVDNIRPLLPEYSVITANQGSNSVILTDAQVNVRRVAEIITALDQSFSEITTVRAFPLEYADARQTATLVTTLFRVETTGGQNNRNNQGTQFRGGGPGGRGNEAANDPANAVLQASSRVAAAADERTNTLVVAAPGAVMPAIEELLVEIDRSTDVLTEVRVFPLRFANATDTATLITNVFANPAAQTGTNRQGGGQRFFAFGGIQGGGQRDAAADQSQRQRAEQTISAVPDARTNSVIVSAVPSVLDQIEQMVTQLDRDPSGTKQVFVYSLKNARPEEVSALIEEMFGSGTSVGTTNRTGTTNRNTTGNQTNRTTGQRAGTGTNR